MNVTRIEIAKTLHTTDADEIKKLIALVCGHDVAKQCNTFENSMGVSINVNNGVLLQVVTMLNENGLLS